jgi:hypothetical protein
VWPGSQPPLTRAGAFTFSQVMSFKAEAQVERLWNNSPPPGAKLGEKPLCHPTHPFPGYPGT